MRDIKVCWNNMYLQGRADWEKGEGGGGGGGGGRGISRIGNLF